MQVSEIEVIGAGRVRRPIDHQPRFFRRLSVLAQAMLQMDFAPGQAGLLLSPMGRLPRTRLPQRGWKAGDDLRQGARGGRIAGEGIAGALALQSHWLRPGLMCRLDLKKKLHPQLAHALTEV